MDSSNGKLQGVWETDCVNVPYPIHPFLCSSLVREMYHPPSSAIVSGGMKFFG